MLTNHSTDRPIKDPGEAGRERHARVHLDLQDVRPNAGAQGGAGEH